MSKIGPALAERLKNARGHDVFRVVIFLKDEPARMHLDFSDVTRVPRGREDWLKRMQFDTENSQAKILKYLSSQKSRPLTLDDGVVVPRVGNVESFWINNSIAAEISPELIKKIVGRGDVAFVEIERRADISELLDSRISDRPPVADSNLTATWSVAHINAPLLWQIGIDGTDVVVAVVDTGVNYDHSDLKNRMWVSKKYPKHGYDFEAGDDDPMDAQGHGTCCAGIVAGDGTSGKRTGVAPGARIMAVRVGGAESQFWSGLQFAITEGADVISMSMTWKYPSNPDYPGWRRVCETILAAGILHANSTGNQGTDQQTYPVPFNIATPGNCPPPWLHPLQLPTGGLSSPISCGATTVADTLAPYSGRGPAAWESGSYTDYPWQGGSQPGLMKPDICAPGPGTESCNFAYDPAVSGSKPYVSFGGTSAATPHIGGCLALLASACIQSETPIVPSRIQQALERTAVRVVGQTTDKENHFGAGRVDVKAAFDYGVSQGWWRSPAPTAALSFRLANDRRRVRVAST